MDFIPLSRAELQGLPSAYPTLFDVCHFILAAIAVRLILTTLNMKNISTTVRMFSEESICIGKSLVFHLHERILLQPGLHTFQPHLQVVLNPFVTKLDFHRLTSTILILCAQQAHWCATLSLENRYLKLTNKNRI